MKRYWPGKLPVWAVTGEQATDEDDDEEEEELQTTRKRKFVGGDDSRLRRLAEARAFEKKNDVRSFHRAEILSTTPEVQPIVDDDDDGEVDDDVLEEKRHKLREKILRFQRQQEEKEQVFSLFQEEEDESEYETTDSEVDDSDLAMMQKKPVYVPKSEWDTIADRERIEAKVRALQSMMENREEERKCETKQILLSLIQQEEDTTLCHTNNDSFDTIIVDDDFNGKEEEQEEYEAWKIRETLRMRRDKVAATLDKGKEVNMGELAKEKEMSPSLGRINNSNPLRRQSKRKWRFMQRYYHKGAFFQSYADDPSAAAGTDDIYARDFSAPTGDDKMNRTLLPKVMHVKQFGRIGRTKWTHLLNEDTTYG